MLLESSVCTWCNQFDTTSAFHREKLGITMIETGDGHRSVKGSKRIARIHTHTQTRGSFKYIL